LAFGYKFTELFRFYFGLNENVLSSARFSGFQVESGGKRGVDNEGPKKG
jgi:hypothetical protein